jgi:hypothetical protein
LAVEVKIGNVIKFSNKGCGMANKEQGRKKEVKKPKKDKKDKKDKK